MKQFNCIAVAVLATTILTFPAICNSAPIYNNNYNAVILGGTTIMRFRVGAGGYTAHQRAVATQERLNKLLGEGPIYASDIVTQMSGLDAVVLVKDQLLFTADAQTAAINDATPIDLANAWADNMRKILPELTAPR
jgi:hypothetical protein